MKIENFFQIKKKNEIENNTIHTYKKKKKKRNRCAPSMIEIDLYTN